jgi:hypothetical protein
LALFRAEESQEEITVRESLALGVTSSDISSNLPEEVQDMNTEDPLPSIQHTATPAAPAPHENVQQTILPAYHGGSLMSERTLALPSSPHAQTLAVDPIPLLPQPASTLDDGEDEDDEMPIINMDSDSD